MFPFFSQLGFLLRATNEHGIHSPFIYRYLTKGIYRKPRKHPKKNLDVLLKSIAYFEFKNIGLPKGPPTVEKLIREAFPHVRINKTPYGLLYLPEPDACFFDNFSGPEELLHDGSLVLVDQIHKDRRAETQWKRMCEADSFRVSIDFFYCGLLFIRKEQATQHFRIRI